MDYAGVLPIAAFIWIVILFLIAIWLPNSLELLRKFHPAFDFQHDPQPASEGARKLSLTVKPFGEARKSLRIQKFRSSWAALKKLGDEGIDFNRFTATMAALLCVLGILALSRGGEFLYWQF